LITSPHSPWSRAGHVTIVEGLFNTRHSLLQFHIGLGLLWIFVFLISGVFGFRTYLRREVLQREIFHK
jgi:hypothetical protein